MTVSGSTRVKTIALPIFLTRTRHLNFVATACLAKAKEVSN